MTANEDLFDAQIRHAIDVRRFTDGEAKRLRQFLEELDADLTRKVRERLAKLIAEGRDPRESRNLQRLEKLLLDLRRERETIIEALQDELAPNLTTFAEAEVAFQASALTAVLPIEIGLATVSTAQLRAMIRTRLFQGRTLEGWFQRLSEADQARLLREINLGVTQGESIDNIVRRLIGTRANGFRDGVLSISRREAEAVVRTAVNHVANASREAFWHANERVIEMLFWNSTLDGRTTRICQARDGQLAPLGNKPLPDSVPASKRLDPPYARPPGHYGCRSHILPVIDGVGILGTRVTITDIRNRRRREIDFRAEARDKAGASWRGMPEAERRRLIAEQRQAWAKANIGEVPADTSYQTFLGRQSSAFQDDVLGKTRAELFRKGGLTVQEFVDRSGRTLTLDELRRKTPEAFERAGV